MCLTVRRSSTMSATCADVRLCFKPSSWSSARIHVSLYLSRRASAC